jgi:hypothetical protein
LTGIDEGEQIISGHKPGEVSSLFLHPIKTARLGLLGRPGLLAVHLW